MDNLLNLVLILGLITVVGHLLWLAIAAGVRLVFSRPREERPEPIRERPAEIQLRELEITTRTIRDLSARGDLDRAAAERVEQGLEARRRSLQRQDIAPAAKATRLAPAASVAQLEELLGGGRGVVGRRSQRPSLKKSGRNLSRLEGDQNVNPTWNTLIRYAAALGKEVALSLRDVSVSGVAAEKDTTGTTDDGAARSAKKPRQGRKKTSRG